LRKDEFEEVLEAGSEVSVWDQSVKGRKVVGAEDIVFDFLLRFDGFSKREVSELEGGE
jgi:hypothetical protein